MYRLSSLISSGKASRSTGSNFDSGSIVLTVDYIKTTLYMKHMKTMQCMKDNQNKFGSGSIVVSVDYIKTTLCMKHMRQCNVRRTTRINVDQVL